MTAQPQPLQRVLLVALLVVAGATVVGFFTGTRDGAYEEKEPVIVPTEEAASEAARPEAPRYEAVPDFTKPAQRPGASLERLTPPPMVADAAIDPESVSGGAETPRTLRRRAEGRAYKGAPPQIPHGISQRSAENCMICHGAGLKVGAAVAPTPTHAHLSNCTQCHVTVAMPTELTALTGVDDPVYNAFAGTTEPAGGTRAWEGAPPTIPHGTRMRTDCAACHGVDGIAGLRTSHPERGNCRQCHASTDRDDMPVVFNDAR